MFKKDSNQNAKSKFSFKRINSLLGKSDSSKIEIAPYRDWRIVGVGFFIILFISFGFNMYILFEVNRDNFFDVHQGTKQEVSFAREGLTRVIGMFAGREETFERLKKEIIKVNDPSQ